MTLTISALSLNDQALSQPFVAHFDASGGTIGRGEQNTLMLPDPERHISRQHARISAEGGGYRITNLSSANVVTVAGRALSAGESAPIHHRDQVRIGGFLLEVSDSAFSPSALAARTIKPPARSAGNAQAAPAAAVGRAPRTGAIDDALGSFATGAGTPSGSAAGTSGVTDPFGGLGDDPLAARAVDDLLGAPGDGAEALAAFLDDSPKRPAGAAAAKSVAATSHQVHDLHAALRPASVDPGRVVVVGGGDATAAPAPQPAAPVPGGQGVAAASPDAADRAGIAPAGARPRPAGDSPPLLLGPAAANARPQPTSPTRVDAKVTTPATLGAAQLGDRTRIHSAPTPLAAASAPMTLDPTRNTPSAPQSHPAPLGESAPAVPRANRVAVPSGAAAAVAAPAAASSDELWQAFCEAAGVQVDAPQGLSPEMMQVIGQLLRAAVDGTLQLMAIRSATTHELRAEKTLIQSRANNPLKLSPDGHAALELLLQPPMRGFLPGPAAMTDAMHDLVGHSIGTMAGMRAALDGVLGRFAPTQLENKLTGKSVIDCLLPMNRRSRLWELYLQHFEAIRDEAQDDFHTLFGRAFLAAYEQQLDRLHEQQAEAAAHAPAAPKP
jgi:FHA domain-containing protein